MKREIQGLRSIMLILTRAYLSLCLIGFMSVLIGCQGQIRDQHPDSVRVRIPLYSNNSYKLQTVDLISVDDIKTLSGWAAKFLISPTLSNGQLIGMQPQINTIRTGSGDYVATDSFSLQLLTLYYHTERLMLLDDQMGVPLSEQKPRAIAVKVKMIGEDGQIDVDNARYNGKLDALLFAPYEREDLPLAVNAGVIAHEHFHSIFYKLIIKEMGKSYPGPDAGLHENENEMERHFGLTKTISKVDEGGLSERALYHSVLLRGLNEGLADFWGWLYTGDTTFVKRSLPQVEEARTLNQGDLKLKKTSELKMETQIFHSWGNANALSYELGSQYARILYASLQEHAGDEVQFKKLKLSLGQKIIRTLQSMSRSLMTMSDSEVLETDQFLKQLQTEIPELKIQYKVGK